MKTENTNETKGTLLVALAASLALGCPADDAEQTPSTTAPATTGSTQTSGTDTDVDEGTAETSSSDTGESSSSGAGTGSSSGSDSSGTETESGTEEGAPYDPGAPSCEGLQTQCGGVSCCTTVNLPAGVVQVGRGGEGSDSCPPEFLSECFSEEVPEHDVAVDAFALDHYVVTVGRFRAFVDAWNDNWRPALGDGQVADVEGSGWQTEWNDFVPPTFEHDCNNAVASTWTDEPGAGEDRPIDCVSWYHAQAFCIWDGGRLPTEAEWEYAAAGADQDRLYPWGAGAIDESRSVFDANEVQPVGTKPEGAARWGHLDMAGNTEEWVYDCYNEDFYETPEASLDNAVVVPGTEGDSPCELDSSVGEDPHVIKGGGTSSNFITYNRVATREGGRGSTPSTFTTFRCARGL